MARTLSESERKEILERYNTLKVTIHQLGIEYGVSDGQIYNSLKNAGCRFSRKWRKPMSEERRKTIGNNRRGKHNTEEQRRAISERNSCNYNGLNGHGHTKKHNFGYVLTYAPKHPHAHKDGYIMLHTVMMEQHIGRYLNSNEVVHHINHKRDDNRIENLVLMDKHEHSAMHMAERHEKRRNDLLTV